MSTMNLYKTYKSMLSFQDQLKFIVNESKKRKISHGDFLFLILDDKNKV